VFVRRSDTDRDLVRQLLAKGLVDSEVAELSGISANTIGRWRRAWSPIEIRWRPAHAPSYAYLLGMYLGDGCLSIIGGGAILRVSCDLRYPQIIDDCWTSMVLSMPRCRPGFVAYSDANAVNVTACGKLWLHAFPQHGPGRKHERAIVLEPWQQEIVD
jgi:hypothetical protein